MGEGGASGYICSFGAVMSQEFLMKCLGPKMNCGSSSSRQTLAS